MPSITTWLRMEPRSREDDIQAGLQARIHDPLWLLGRQWQFNEFKAEDSGSPVATKLEADAVQLTRCFLGPLPASGTAAGQPFDPAGAPLETMVEREPYARSGRVDLRLAVDAGRYLMRLLDALGVAPAYGAALLKQFPVQPLTEEVDAESARFAAAMAGRTIDGARVYSIFRAALPGLPAVPPVTAADQEKVLAAAKSYVDWFQSLASEPGADNTTWMPNRMEYAFAVSAASQQGEIVLDAPDYREGNLDWFSFNIRTPGTLGSTANEARQESIVRNVIPAPASYPGMPAERWWELEDNQIDFGAIQTLPGDLTGLVLLQFAVTYGNDWFVVPIDLKIGTLLRIRAVTVTDSFGIATAVPSFSQTAAADNWRMFTLSSILPPDANWFFLPPALGPSLYGPALESVLLARDEMANMAWAIEKQVQDPTGKTVDRMYSLPEQVTATAIRNGTELPARDRSPGQLDSAGAGQGGAANRIRLRRGVLGPPAPFPKERSWLRPGPWSWRMRRCRAAGAGDAEPFSTPGGATAARTYGSEGAKIRDEARPRATYNSILRHTQELVLPRVTRLSTGQARVRMPGPQELSISVADSHDVSQHAGDARSRASR